MPPLPRLDRAWVRSWPLRSWRRLAGSLVGLLIAVLLIAGASAILQFKHRAESGMRAQIDLQKVMIESQYQSALELGAVSGRARLADVRDSLSRSRARSESMVANVDGGGLGRAATSRIITLQQQYAASVDRELALLSDGNREAAADLARVDVVPDFLTLRTALVGDIAQVATVAERAENLSFYGWVLVVVGALLLAALLNVRRRLAETRLLALRRSADRYRALVHESADIVMITNRGGKVKYLSPAAIRLFRQAPGSNPSQEEITGAIHPDDRPILEAHVTSDAAKPAAGAPVTVEIRVQTRAVPGWRHFEVSIQDLFADPAVNGLVLTGRDVTDQRALQREVERRVLHDNLTGLPNRALLSDRLAQAVRVAHRQGLTVGLLLIDLDRFKEVNDTLGHHYGDQLLALIGPRLAEDLRDMDTVARFGGDEFAVLLPSVRDLQGATEVAFKLQAALSRPFHVQGVQLDIEASVGVVISGAHGDDANTLIQRADIAMYVAKQGGLGVSTYHRDIDSNTPERLALLGDLRRALQNDELFLDFQPQIALATGEIASAEALLRWRHPERGLIAPDGFILLAENTGMIGPLTHHVLDQALAQIRIWADQGRPMPVAVNLSARNLLDDRLDVSVRELMAQHGVPAELLKLEVTESAIMTDPERAAELLNRLAAMGIEISIDDFGAGYTSMRQLKDLPVSELKVDRSFVADMEADPSNGVIVRSVIELGHNLGMTIVGEGVETTGSLEALTDYGCDVVQGFLLARPMAAAAFDEWRDAWVAHPAMVPALGSAGPGPVPDQRRSPGRVPHA